MRIIHIITGLSYGGAETLLLEMCKEHKRLGNWQKVIYLIPENELVSKFEKQGIETHFIDVKKRPIWASIKLYRAIKQFLPEIVHTHLPRADMFGRLACLFIPNIKVFSTIHNTDSWKRSKLPHYVVLRLFNRLSINLLQRMFLLSVSEEVRRYCIKYEKIRPDKIVTILNFVPVNPDKRTGMTNRKTLEIPKDSFVFVNVGRLVSQKNQMQILTAAEYFKQKRPNLVFIIIGEGEERNRLERIIRVKDIRNVILTGNVANVYDYYDLGDLLLLTSKHEGLPIVVLEAFSNHLPVLSSDLEAVQEILKHGWNGIVYRAEDSKSLLQTIEDVLDGKYDLKQIAENAYQSALKLSLANYMKLLLKQYEGGN